MDQIPRAQEQLAQAIEAHAAAQQDDEVAAAAIVATQAALDEESTNIPLTGAAPAWEKASKARALAEERGKKTAAIVATTAKAVGAAESALHSAEQQARWAEEDRILGELNAELATAEEHAASVTRIRNAVDVRLRAELGHMVYVRDPWDRGACPAGKFESWADLDRARRGEPPPPWYAGAGPVAAALIEGAAAIGARTNPQRVEGGPPLLDVSEFTADESKRLAALLLGPLGATGIVRELQLQAERAPTRAELELLARLPLSEHVRITPGELDTLRGIVRRGLVRVEAVAARKREPIVRSMPGADAAYRITDSRASSQRW